MSDNILPFPESHRGRERPSVSDARQQEEANERREAESRHIAAETFWSGRPADPRRKRGPTIRNDADRSQLARNLDSILSYVESKNKRRIDVLEAANLGNPSKDSTKILYAYTLPYISIPEVMASRCRRLSRRLDIYDRLARSAGQLLGLGDYWFISDLIRDTSYSESSLNRIPPWLGQIRDLLNGLADAAMKRNDGLQAYLEDISCGYIGWHPTLGFGEFDSLHLGGPVVVRDRRPVDMSYMGFIPAIHLYSERLGSHSFDDVVACSGAEIITISPGESLEKYRQKIRIHIYREIYFGIAPFGKERAWAGCFEKRVRFHFQTMSKDIWTFDPFGGAWDTSVNPSVAARSDVAPNDFWIDLINLPDNWLHLIPFDCDLREQDRTVGQQFWYERVDLSSCQKYLGTPRRSSEISLGEWWGDVREADREDSWWDEYEWDHSLELTKPTLSPAGTIARAVELNLTYESPHRRLDRLLFEAVVNIVAEAAARREEMDRDRDRRVRDLKAEWAQP